MQICRGVATWNKLSLVSMFTHKPKVMEPSQKVKIRGKNFTPVELELLEQLTSQCVVLSSGTRSVRKKNAAWKEITETFNSHQDCSTHRTLKQLKKRWTAQQANDFELEDLVNEVNSPNFLSEIDNFVLNSFPISGDENIQNIEVNVSSVLPKEDPSAQPRQKKVKDVKIDLVNARMDYLKMKEKSFIDRQNYRRMQKEELHSLRREKLQLQIKYCSEKLWRNYQL